MKASIVKSNQIKSNRISHKLVQKKRGEAISSYNVFLQPNSKQLFISKLSLIIIIIYFFWSSFICDIFKKTHGAWRRRGLPCNEYPWDSRAKKGNRLRSPFRLDGAAAVKEEKMFKKQHHLQAPDLTVAVRMRSLLRLQLALQVLETVAEQVSLQLSAVSLLAAAQQFLLQPRHLKPHTAAP